jgi:Asp/Glu/hydantoin racemase
MSSTAPALRRRADVGVIDGTVAAVARSDGADA